MKKASDFPSLQDASRAAFLARKSGDIAAAAPLYRDLPQAFPGKEAIALAAAGLRMCGYWSEGVGLLESTLAENPNSPALVIVLAESYLEVNQFARAVAAVEAYLKIEPGESKVWIYLADLRGKNSDWPGAVQAAAQALKLDPLNHEAVLAQGDAFYKIGRIEDAVAAYRRAVALKPDSAQGHFRLGSILAEGPNAAEAKSALLRAVEIDPTHAPAHVNLAGFYLRAGKSERAIYYGRRAIELDSNLAVAYSTMGMVLLEAGQFSNAVQILRIGAELAPSDVLMLMALATAENLLGDARAAERVLQRIIALEPENLEARHMLAAVNGEPVKTVPAGYSRQLFNWYAPKFDRMLAGMLQYRAPEDVADLLVEQRPAPQAFKRLLDLGCGTGLVAEALAKRYAFDRKVGVDVAEKMIDISRAKNLYDELIHGDAGDVLAGHPGGFDLVTAIDMFIYVGDLSGLMPRIAAALTPDGVMAYSIELMAQGKYKLMPTGRFAHTQKYVEDLAGAHGLVPLVSRTVTLRQENGANVSGLIGLLRRA